MAHDVKRTCDANSARSISVEDLLPVVDTTLRGVTAEQLTSSIIASVSSVILKALLNQPLKSTTSSRITETRS